MDPSKRKINQFLLLESSPKQCVFSYFGHYFQLTIGTGESNQKNIYSRLPITRTLANSNLALTRTSFPFLSGHFLYNVTLDNSNPRYLNSNLFQFPLKVRVIGSRLYSLMQNQTSSANSTEPIDLNRTNRTHSNV